MENFNLSSVCLKLWVEDISETLNTEFIAAVGRLDAGTGIQVARKI
jgi:hypothetical protein